MKLPLRLKWLVLASLHAMYFTGLITWVMGYWFQVQTAFGNEPSPFRLWWLQLHSIVSLWFLILFGYLFHAHVQPAWRRRKKRRSGAVLTGTLIFLIATVPGLFYIANEYLKSWVAMVHADVGLTVLLIFLLHYYSKDHERR